MARSGGHLADRLDAAMKRPVALRASGAASIGVEVIPTGVLTLDLALGIGGWPCGRVVEIFGDEATGKTTLGLTGLAQAQRRGYECLYVDVEQAIDFSYAEELGVDLDLLAIAQPTSGEEALEVSMEGCKAGARYIVIDSVAALVPKAEVEGGMLKQSMGAQARLMSQALRSLIGAAKQANAVLMFINQTRSKVGVVYGSPRTTTGGSALKFYSSARLDLKGNGKVEGKGAVQIGIKTKGTVVKNKLAPPMAQAVWEIVWGKGIDRGADLVTAGLACGVLSKAGNSIMLGKVKIGASYVKACDTLRTDEQTGAEVEAECRAKQVAAMHGEVLEHSDPDQDTDVDLSEPEDEEVEP